MTKDERDIYVFAFRYALPRHTYAFSTVSDGILQNIRSFENWEIFKIIKEIDDFEGEVLSQDRRNCSIDTQQHLEFKERLLDEIARRAKDQ